MECEFPEDWDEEGDLEEALAGCRSLGFGVGAGLEGPETLNPRHGCRGKRCMGWGVWGSGIPGLNVWGFRLKVRELLKLMVQHFE